MIDTPVPLSFNLWTDPWIDIERCDGTFARLGIEKTLLTADQIRAVISSSPLDIVGIHRLLTAILQDIFNPQTYAHLEDLICTPVFPEEAIRAFGRQYASRFDLFSVEAPFLQSADLTLSPNRKTPLKTIGYLAPLVPSGTAVVHFHHGQDDRQVFCPACCARGLVNIPAFATSGGAGIKPSINGVPPLYVLPAGLNLKASLAASLLIAPFQPAVRASQHDQAWWRRQPVVKRSQEVSSVGYLHSLTFPARRVRLHPLAGPVECTLCGEKTDLSVRTMVFEMGEARSKDAPFWFDPFAAYFLREKEGPLPLRPSPSKAAWREFGSLFLTMPETTTGTKKRHPIRPQVVEQWTRLGEQGITDRVGAFDFRCIGMRTDMKAKIFEWVDTTFNVPLALMKSADAGLDIEDALAFAGDCVRTAQFVFRAKMNAGKKNGERFAHERQAIQEMVWQRLADPFQVLIGNLEAIEKLTGEERRGQRKDAMVQWGRTVVLITLKVTETIFETMGDDGQMLRQRYECMSELSSRLFGSLKKMEETTNA